MVALAGVGMVLFAFGLRLSTFWKCRHRGCDAYYFLLSSQEFRKRRRLPIVLPPIYLLEQQEQWYPPGFSMVLSLIPEGWLNKYYWLISPAVDCAIVAIVYGLVYVMTQSIGLAALGSFLYAINSASITHCTNLNSRGLASLLFCGAMLGVMGYSAGGNALYAVLAVVSGVGLLMTHKLSPQLLYVLLPAMSLVFWDATYLVGLVVIVVATFVATRGFLFKIWRGHADILKFWNTHWPNLGAHQVNSSPMYVSGNEDSNKMFQGGWGGLFKQAQYMVMNPVAIMLVFPILRYEWLTLFDKQMLWWAGLTYVFAIATTFIKPLRFLGEGHRYLQLAAVPVSYLAIVPFWRGWWGFDPWLYIAMCVSIVVAAVIYWRLYQFMSDPKRTLVPFVDDDLQRVIDFLKGVETHNIYCVPDSLGDAVGYYTRKGVLRGTHNYPFSMVDVFFPVYKVPLEYIISAYQVSHLVVSKGYVDPERLGLDSDNLVLEAGNYGIFEMGA